MTLNTASRSTDWMPCVPRSITRDRPPVWRSRWKRSDSACRWRKVRSATRRAARCCTAANTASRSSPKPEEATRSSAVAQDQRHRHSAARRAAALRRQRIDRAAVDHRHVDGRDLGRHQEQHGHDHARPRRQVAARPQIGQQRADGLPMGPTREPARGRRRARAGAGDGDLPCRGCGMLGTRLESRPRGGRRCRTALLRHMRACNNAMLPGERLAFRIGDATGGLGAPGFAAALARPARDHRRTRRAAAGGAGGFRRSRAPCPTPAFPLARRGVRRARRPGRAGAGADRPRRAARVRHRRGGRARERAGAARGRAASCGSRGGRRTRASIPASSTTWSPAGCRPG